MKKIIGIILIILSLYLGYMGVTTFSNSGESVEILGVELSAEDKQEKSTSFIYLGLAVVTLIGGVALVKSKN
jgi:hypothetical protein